MRIVATSDTHYPFDADMIPDGDVFIHAGDLMYTGYVDEWKARLESLAALPHKIKLLIPGNHDYHIQNYTGVAVAELRKEAGVKVVGLREPVIKLGKLNLLGIPYVTGIPGWAYNVDDEWLYDHLTNATAGENIDIVVSHAPVYSILDAVNPEKKDFYQQTHVGTMAANRWFYKQEAPPKVWIHGHIHESYGRRTMNGCTFYNVAMCDRNYDQTNKPMVIDL